MLEISRIVTALGAVAASSGLIIYGIGASYLTPDDFETTLGLWLMILGTLATVIGLALYKRNFLEED